jgi:hypothetical protein
MQAMRMVMEAPGPESWQMSEVQQPVLEQGPAEDDYA